MRAGLVVMEILTAFAFTFLIFFVLLFYMVNRKSSLSFLVQLMLGTGLALLARHIGVSLEYALIGLGITLTMIYWMPK